MNEQKNKIKQSLRGTVVSVSGAKTAVIKVVRYFKHPKYQKYLRRTKKYHADDIQGLCKAGDFVVIEPSRPISGKKRWAVKEKIS